MAGVFTTWAHRFIDFGQGHIIRKMPFEVKQSRHLNFNSGCLTEYCSENVGLTYPSSKGTGALTNKYVHGQLYPVSSLFHILKT